MTQLPTTRTFFLFPLEVKSLSEVDCNFNFFQVQWLSNMLHFTCYKWVCYFELAVHLYTSMQLTTELFGFWVVSNMFQKIKVALESIVF